ncbi:protein JASON-like [Silene latifolia]|uniref:protein JASON-like n=1 Tax=Silene latifolia TaxID=37657 RepID=UPI003D789DA4
MPLTYCDVFASLWRSFLAMGCFFDCFRVRNDPNRPRPRSVPDSSPPPPLNATEHVAEKIHLSSLFTAEEKKECVVTDQENLVPPVARSGVDESLLEEVRLLKACGTLPQTPVEIRKAVKFSDQVEKSEMKRRPNALESAPDTPAAIPAEELEIFESANSKSPETPEENSEISHVQVPSSVMKASPYATPRKITDDMQTPGTVYATSMKSLTQGNGRIRSQYVYTTLNPIDGLSQLEDLKETSETTSPETTSPVVGSSQKLVNNESLGDATLSSWLKPNQEENIRKPNGRNIPGERPIIGLVAAHWNEQEKTPHVPPKWFDGNGIPNSTTKYKEDQKVRWHATPFEERLEKALSEETCVPQRKSISGAAPIIFEELEGQEDTASSQLKTAPKPVESF